MNRTVRTLSIVLLASTINGNMAQAQDFSNVRSGLLLGVYANAGYDGMRVTGTIPGYSAVGRLFPGDVLVRATTDGVQIHELRSHWAMENAKSAIGPHRPAAIEIYRPSQGYLYAWVEFSPISGPTAVYSTRSGQPAPAAKGKAIFRMENEKSGARQLFRNARPKSNHTTGRPTPLLKRPSNTQANQNSNRDAANLFGRR